jgi:DNA-binding NarL/FixJ family response regulator
LHVVAYLPPALLSHLKIVLSDRHQVTPVDGWEMLDAAVRKSEVDIVVLDPTTPGTVRLDETVLLQERFPSLRVVVYTSLTPSAMRMVVELAKHGLQHVVLHRFDDDPRRF